MKGVIYARESSDDTNKAPSIEKQIEIGKKYLEENKIELIKIYQDDGYSGGDWTRPDWNKLVREGKGHLFSFVWVFAQDRIARDTEQFLWFYRNLKESYIKVYSHTEREIDLETVGGLAQNISLAMASHLFRKITSEKVKKAHEQKKKKAEKEGLPLVWGRKKNKLDLEKVKQLRNDGMGYRTIAKEMGVSYQTIRRALQNPPTKI